MSKSIALLLLCLCPVVLPGCPDEYANWQGGCPLWEPQHTPCVVAQCEADLEAGVDREDSWACRDVDAMERNADTGEDSDTGQ